MQRWAEHETSGAFLTLQKKICLLISSTRRRKNLPSWNTSPPLLLQGIAPSPAWENTINGNHCSKIQWTIYMSKHWKQAVKVNCTINTAVNSVVGMTFCYLLNTFQRVLALPFHLSWQSGNFLLFFLLHLLFSSDNSSGQVLICWNISKECICLNSMS